MHALLLLLVSASPDNASLAEKIVADVAVVKEKEVVLLVGAGDDLPLLRELYVAAAKRGAQPLIRIDEVDLARRWFEIVPERFDANAPALEEKLIPLADVVITVDRRDSAALKKVPAARRMAAMAAFGKLGELRNKRGTRQIYLGNGLFPSKESAKAVGVSEGDLKKLYEAGIGVDYGALGGSAQAVKALLAPGKPINIRTPAGTDLKLTLGKKPLVVSDGVIGTDDVKAGGAALTTWLPAGEVYGLVDGADGKIVQPRLTFDGEDIKDLVITVQAGKVTSMTAKPSKAFDAFKALYDAGPAGKDALSTIDIGVNPGVKAKGKKLNDFVTEGTVSLNVGGDDWAGGTNTSGYGATLYLPDATVTVDGNVFIENGDIKFASK